MQFALVLAGILANYLKSVHNKAAQGVGDVIDEVDQATMAILQENARIKGIVIDWTDPTAVRDFLATLPKFTPIPEPEKS